MRLLLFFFKTLTDYDVFGSGKTKGTDLLVDIDHATVEIHRREGVCECDCSK